MLRGGRGRGRGGSEGGAFKRSSSSTRSGSSDGAGGRGGGRYGGGRSRFEGRSHSSGSDHGRGRAGSSSSGAGRGGGGFGLGRGRGTDRNPMAGGYRPQVSEHSLPVHARQAMQAAAAAAAAGGGGRGGEGSPAAAARSQITRVPRGARKGKDVVVILEQAGLLLGHMGIVDAYERAATTELANESLKDVRPDIVHQCLLALCDSELAHENRLRIYISSFSRNGKVIEVSPALRPPRTYGRFRGLMASLLREGHVTSLDGQVLMRVMPGSVAPVIPNGAEVTAVSNSMSAPVVTASKLGEAAHAKPVDDALQGGVKGVEAFYVIACTDDCDTSSVDYVTRTVSLSAYPSSAHVMCARLCEGHARAAATASAAH